MNRRRCFATLAAAGLLAMGGAASAAECDVTSVGFTPIDDLGTGTYQGFVGGLYPAGSNQPPAAHRAAGRARAAAIQPLDTNGQPSPTGSHVLLSIGMSNATQEYCGGFGGQCSAGSFTGQALQRGDELHPGLVIANGARGGQAAPAWASPSDPNYDRVRDDVLAPAGLTEAQVQAVWLKNANGFPQISLPAPNADAFTLMGTLADIARAVRTRYPNAQMILLSSRIYAGYASNFLNPEPYAYESGFSVKWLIEAQIDQMAGGGMDPIAGDLAYDSAAPWLGWAAYLWADGETPRSDGLVWECADLEADGTHPSTSGETKVGGLLLDFMLDSEFTTPWFTAPAPSAGNSAGAAFAALAWLARRARRRVGG